MNSRLYSLCPGAGHQAMFHHRKHPIPARMEAPMSLRKKPAISEKQIAASWANGRQSHVPATLACGERIRAADLAPNHPRY